MVFNINMNNFATIKHINSYKKVEYYSVCLEHDDFSLFELFLRKHTKENKEKLNHILKWIQVIGDKFGASRFFFRPEAEIADASALPPTGINREPAYIEFNSEKGEHENAANNLRLYCFRVNEHVVFLFNGDIKTRNRAQDCENVRSHFRLANKLTSVIESSFGNEICWNEHKTDIIIEHDFELNW